MAVVARKALFVQPLSNVSTAAKNCFPPVCKTGISALGLGTDV